LKQLREQYREIMKENPVLICSNHLTLIDSIIQGVIFNSILGHLIEYSKLPWNVPEKTNFYHNLYWRIFCYLGKCIAVNRQGSPEDAKKTREKMLYVIKKGDVLSIFPEGTRSRNGRINMNVFSYGTGQLLQHFPNTKVLCVYMRGKKFGGFGDFPPTGENFHLDMKLFSPKSNLKGLRKVRDLSTQIVSRLRDMEQEYFANAVLCG